LGNIQTTHYALSTRILPTNLKARNALCEIVLNCDEMITESLEFEFGVAGEAWVIESCLQKNAGVLQWKYL
jgi:hypothetical protein